MSSRFVTRLKLSERVTREREIIISSNRSISLHGRLDDTAHQAVKTVAIKGFSQVVVLRILRLFNLHTRHTGEPHFQRPHQRSLQRRARRHVWQASTRFPSTLDVRLRSMLLEKRQPMQMPSQTFLDTFLVSWLLDVVCVPSSLALATDVFGCVVPFLSQTTVNLKCCGLNRESTSTPCSAPPTLHHMTAHLLAILNGK